MIKSITVENIFSYKGITKVSFVEGLNVITGSSWSGKSALLDAIQWVIANRPLGDSVRNWYCKEDDLVRVTIEFDDCIITKKRQNNVTWYELNTKEYGVVKYNVPEEITSMINLADYNVRTQEEPYFLVGDTSGKVAERLNELIGLDIIDTLFTNLTSRIKIKKTYELLSKDELEKAEKKLCNYSLIDKIEEHINSLSDKEDVFEKLQQRIQSISSYLTNITDVIKKIDKYSGLLSSEVYHKKIKKKLDLYQNKSTMYFSLDNLITKVNQHKEQVSSEEDWLSCEQYVVSLKEKLIVYANNTKRVNTLESLVIQHKKQKEIQEKLQKKLGIDTTEYVSILKQEKTCPVCGSSISEDTIIQIIERM